MSILVSMGLPNGLDPLSFSVFWASAVVVVVLLVHAINDGGDK